ncbi:hypothetical protein D3C72_1896470 [compost metagenome]
MGVRARAVPAQQADDEKTAQHPDRGVPSEHPLLQQKRATGKKGQVHPFDAGATDMAKRRIASEELVHGQALVDAQAVQRGGLRPGIRKGGIAESEAENALQAFKQAHPVGCWPLGHLLRETHQHQGKTEHRRVERVFTDAAIQVLAEDHREGRCAHCQPPRAIRW